MDLFLTQAAWIVDHSPRFDSAWYHRTYRLSADTDAAIHYLMEGSKKGWDPSANFSTEGYLQRNPEVRWGGMNPLLHYEAISSRKGSYEGVEETDALLTRKCACCGSFLTKYHPLSPEYLNEGAKHGAAPWRSEMGNTEAYSCPWCNAADRERAYAIWMKRELTPEFDGKILDIAPAATLSRFIHENFPKADYKTSDLYMDHVDYHMDIMDMKELEAESIDFFMCSHVLEHVRDDRKAMRELHRILKPSGCGILVVPIDLNQTEIDEDPDCMDIGERWRRFGQDDHIRKYSRAGYIARLKEAGFRVLEFQKAYFGAQAMYENALTETATVYVVVKQE